MREEQDAPASETRKEKNPGIGRSTLINLAGLLVPTVVGLATVPLYLKEIGEVRYGVLLLAFTFLGYFGAFDLGLGRAVAQRIARQDDITERNHTFWTAFLISSAMGIIGAIILFFLGHWLFATIFRIPANLRAEMENAIPWLAAIVPLTAVISVLAGALEARQAFLALSVSQTIGVVGLQVLPLALAILGHDTMWVLLAAALSGRLLGVIALLFSSARIIPLQGLPHIHRSEIGPLLRFGGWVSVSGIISPLLTVVDRFIIATQIGTSAVTNYVIPYNITQRFSYLPYALSTTLFPRFSNLEKKSASELMRLTINSISSIQTPIMILSIFLLYPIFSFWLGIKIAEQSAPVAAILLFGVFINTLAYIPFTYLQGSGKPRIPAIFHVIELPPYVLILYVLINKFGIMGAAWAWVIRVIIDATLLFTASSMFTTLIKCMPNIILIFVATIAFLEIANNKIFILTLFVLLSLSLIKNFASPPEPLKNTFNYLALKIKRLLIQCQK